MWVIEKSSTPRQFIPPSPVFTRTGTVSGPRTVSTVSTPDSPDSFGPSRPVIRSRTTDPAFYLYPTSRPISSNAGTSISMSDDPLVFGQTNEPSPPLPAGASTMDRTFQGLPPIPTLRSLRSMMELPRSRDSSISRKVEVGSEKL